MKLRTISARSWEALSSLNLTLACLLLLMVLVVLCTLAQVHMGTLGAVNAYIRSVWIWQTVPGLGVSLPILPGGATVGALLVVNLLATQLKTFELSWRQAGLWLVHAGLILLISGEFVAGAFQQDWQLSIEEGETLNHLESQRKLELAVIDTTDPTLDHIHGVPTSLLERGGLIQIPQTPLSFSVKSFHPNADLVPLVPGKSSALADRGLGTEFAIQPRPSVTDEEQVNRAVAVVEIFAGGRSHGSWLVSNVISAPQTFVHEDRNYSLVMRARHQYLPYSITLKEFRHDLYPGTDIPKNFASLIHLSNPSKGEERDVLISMNQPLRYQGKTFYQASFGKGDTLSIFQVVENPGWFLPYLSCILVTVGLAIHFAVSLRRALRRRSVAVEAST